MKKLIAVSLSLICASVLNAQWNSGMNFNSSSSSDNGYSGNSGRTYQYDSSKYEDRIRYQYDYNAQQRDRQNDDYGFNNDRANDQRDGQYGMGIYND